MVAYPLGLLQLLCKLLQSLGMFLSHLLHLSLVDTALVLHGSLQKSHLLLTFGPEKIHILTIRSMVSSKPFVNL